MPILLTLLVLCADASDRAYTRLHAEHGLDVDHVGEITFDQRGFLYVASDVGVRQFDGRRFRAVPSPPEAAAPWRIQALPDGGLLVQTDARRIFTVHDGVWRELARPDDEGARGWAHGDSEGQLWLVHDHRLYRWADSPASPGAFVAHALPELGEQERIIEVHDRGGGLTVMTTRGALRLEGGQTSRLLRLPTHRRVIDVLEDEDGTVLLLTFRGALERWPAGEVEAERPLETLADRVGRGIGLMTRGETTWVFWDHRLGRMQDGRLAELVPMDITATPQLGPDGALFISTPAGVVLLPEPDTVTLSERDGLPKPTVRYLSHHQGRVWVSTWGGSVQVDDLAVQAMPPDVTVRDRWCVDGAGVAHAPAAINEGGPTAMERAWVSWDADGHRLDVRLGTGTWGGCTTDGEGVVWLAEGTDLWRRAPGEPPRRVGENPVGGSGTRLLYDGADQVWAALGDQACHALPDQARDGRWTCLDLTDFHPREVTAALARPDGWTWLSTRAGGLLRTRGGRVEKHPAYAEALGTNDLLGLRPSPRGGQWLFGNGLLVRVDDELRELERLGRWNGMQLRSASDILELDDGSLWIATNVGVVHMPPGARNPPASPPPLQVVRVAVDGHPLPHDRPIRVPPPPSRVTVDVAALSFRDRSRIRYRMRAGDEPYRPLEDGSIELVDLPPGARSVAVEASLGGPVWSEPVVIELQVAAPWWQSPWLAVAVAASLALMLWGAYRLRVAWLVSRERERTDLAMDLHDELGSGLGSIRLLASVLERQDLDESDRTTLASRITRNAGDLHESVQQLVSSLRTGGAHTDELLRRLTDRAHDLFADPDVQVEIVAPGAVRRLDLDEVRDLERIASEALHNAARHAQASHVTLGMALEDGRLRLWIEDDGQGFDAAQTDSAGLGMTSMRARSERIGARLDVRSSPGQGTTITAWTRRHRAWGPPGPRRRS